MAWIPLLSWVFRFQVLEILRSSRLLEISVNFRQIIEKTVQKKKQRLLCAVLADWIEMSGERNPDKAPDHVILQTEEEVEREKSQLYPGGKGKEKKWMKSLVR